MNSETKSKITATFTLNGMTSDEFGVEFIEDLDGKIVEITSCACEGCYDIVTEDGCAIYAVSEIHLRNIRLVSAA